MRADASLWLLSSPPFEVSVKWREWLGLRAERLARANLFLVGLQSSDAADVLNEEDQILERKTRFVFIALAILGLRLDNVGLILGGSALPEPTGFLVRTISDTAAMFHNGVPGTLNLTEKDLARAAQMGECLTSLSSRSPVPRLFRGVRSFVSGLETRQGAERLHGFVRSLDAVTKLPPGKSTKSLFEDADICGRSRD